jgi:pimeloyl-ACP methyl ester carboxylesterase
MDQIEVAGLHIAYEQAGEGPPVVLLHGGLADGRVWRRQLDDLSDEFTVVAWDAPGCGRSSDPPATFRLPDYADGLAAFIEALGLGRPHVIGSLFGGGLALELYRRRPTLPMTLVLASAYLGWAGSFPPEVVEQRLQRVLREAALPPDEWVSGYIPALLTQAAPKELVDELVGIMSDSRPAGMRVMAHAFAEADLRDVLPHIDVPTLLLWGEAEPRASLDGAAEFAAKLPSSTLVLLPGTGPQSNMEAPAAFNDEVRRFLHSVGS